MKTKLLKISELAFDSNLYPRMKVGWLTAYQYAQAMRAGSIFPPILVGRLKGKLYVVDGWHRLEAKKMLKEEYVEAMVKNYENKRDMIVESIRLNSTHGRPLSVQEKVRLIYKLEDLEFRVEEISEIVKVPVGNIERLKARIIIGPNGKPVYLKSIVARAKPEEEDALGVDMDRFNVRSVSHLLGQLIELLESGVYPFDDEAVKGLTVRVYGLLGEMLKLTPIEEVSR